MADTSQSEPLEPQVNGVEGLDDDEKSKMRPADIDADMREMERRKRVEMIMNSRLFREELERIIDTQMKDGNGPSGLLQQLSEMMGVQGGRMQTGMRSSSCVVPINDIRGVESMGYAKGEKMLRCKLAAVYRLMDLYGWTQGIHNHITARLNQDQELFLVNPYGMLYNEITASSLVKIDMQGTIIEQGTTNFGVNVAGFMLHSAIHSARPDVKCVVHVHTPAVLAVSSLKCGLLPVCQEAVVVGEVSHHQYLGGMFEPEERDKIARNLGPMNKVLFLANHGAVCCGETVEEAFYNVYNTVLACETQVKLMPMGVDNLLLVSDESRKQIYEAARRAPDCAPKHHDADQVARKEKQWRIGGVDFEALMRMLDNAGFRTGYIYRHPLVKGEPPRPRNDVEVPPAVSSLGYLFDEEEMYKHGPWKKYMDGRKTHDRTRWLNSPNVYQKVEILETGTPDPKKITKWVESNAEEWVADGSPTHSSTPVKIESALQFVPKNTHPREFKKLQQQIKDNRRADKITSGPQSHILEGVSWEEAKKLQDANITQTGDQVILVGAASKGIIQRGYQHNATVYKTPYAKNPFDTVTDDDLEEYKRVVERKNKGESFDEDQSESDALSSSVHHSRRSHGLRSPLMSPTTASETEEESRDEPRVLRIETKHVPRPSQAEVVLSDAGSDFPEPNVERSKSLRYSNQASHMLDTTGDFFRSFSLGRGHRKSKVSGGYGQMQTYDEQKRIPHNVGGSSCRVPNPTHFHHARYTRLSSVHRLTSANICRLHRPPNAPSCRPEQVTTSEMPKYLTELKQLFLTTRPPTTEEEPDTFEASDSQYEYESQKKLLLTSRPPTIEEEPDTFEASDSQYEYEIQKKLYVTSHPPLIEEETDTFAASDSQYGTLPVALGSKSSINKFLNSTTLNNMIHQSFLTNEQLDHATLNRGLSSRPISVSSGIGESVSTGLESKTSSNVSCEDLSSEKYRVMFSPLPDLPCLVTELNKLIGTLYPWQSEAAINSNLEPNNTFACARSDLDAETDDVRELLCSSGQEEKLPKATKLSCVNGSDTLSKILSKRPDFLGHAREDFGSCLEENADQWAQLKADCDKHMLFVTSQGHDSGALQLGEGLVINMDATRDGEFMEPKVSDEVKSKDQEVGENIFLAVAQQEVGMEDKSKYIAYQILHYDDTTSQGQEIRENIELVKMCHVDGPEVLLEVSCEAGDHVKLILQDEKTADNSEVLEAREENVLGNEPDAVKTAVSIDSPNKNENTITMCDEVVATPEYIGSLIVDDDDAHKSDTSTKLLESPVDELQVSASSTTDKNSKIDREQDGDETDILQNDCLALSCATNVTLVPVDKNCPTLGNDVASSKVVAFSNDIVDETVLGSNYFLPPLTHDSGLHDICWNVTDEILVDKEHDKACESELKRAENLFVLPPDSGMEDILCSVGNSEVEHAVKLCNEVGGTAVSDEDTLHNVSPISDESAVDNIVCNDVCNHDEICAVSSIEDAYECIAVGLTKEMLFPKEGCHDGESTNNLTAAIVVVEVESAKDFAKKEMENFEGKGSFINTFPLSGDAALDQVLTEDAQTSIDVEKDKYLHVMMVQPDRDIQEIATCESMPSPDDSYSPEFTGCDGNIVVKAVSVNLVATESVYNQEIEICNSISPTSREGALAEQTVLVKSDSIQLMVEETACVQEMDMCDIFPLWSEDIEFDELAICEVELFDENNAVELVAENIGCAQELGTRFSIPLSSEDAASEKVTAIEVVMRTGVDKSIDGVSAEVIGYVEETGTYSSIPPSAEDKDAEEVAVDAAEKGIDVGVLIEDMFAKEGGCVHETEPSERIPQLSKGVLVEVAPNEVEKDVVADELVNDLLVEETKPTESIPQSPENVFKEITADEKEKAVDVSELIKNVTSKESERVKEIEVCDNIVLSPEYDEVNKFTANNKVEQGVGVDAVVNDVIEEEIKICGISPAPDCSALLESHECGMVPAAEGLRVVQDMISVESVCAQEAESHRVSGDNTVEEIVAFVGHKVVFANMLKLSDVQVKEFVSDAAQTKSCKICHVEDEQIEKTVNSEDCIDLSQSSNVLDWLFEVDFTEFVENIAEPKPMECPSSTPKNDSKLLNARNKSDDVSNSSSSAALSFDEMTDATSPSTFGDEEPLRLSNSPMLTPTGKRILATPIADNYSLHIRDEMNGSVDYANLSDLDSMMSYGDYSPQCNSTVLSLDPTLLSSPREQLVEAALLKDCLLQGGGDGFVVMPPSVPQSACRVEDKLAWKYIEDNGTCLNHLDSSGDSDVRVQNNDAELRYEAKITPTGTDTPTASCETEVQSEVIGAVLPAAAPVCQEIPSCVTYAELCVEVNDVPVDAEAKSKVKNVPTEAEDESQVKDLIVVPSEPARSVANSRCLECERDASNAPSARVSKKSGASVDCHAQGCPFLQPCDCATVETTNVLLCLSETNSSDDQPLLSSTSPFLSCESEFQSVKDDLSASANTLDQSYSSADSDSSCSTKEATDTTSNTSNVSSASDVKTDDTDDNEVDEPPILSWLFSVELAMQGK